MTMPLVMHDNVEGKKISWAPNVKTKNNRQLIVIAARRVSLSRDEHTDYPTQSHLP